MAQNGADAFPVLEPKLQIAFCYMLKAMRETYLGEALSDTVKKLDIKSIDDELNRYVHEASLARVAGFGLRGERVFPVPCVITANSSLLGYYRLLYGLSQKGLNFPTTRGHGVRGHRRRSLRTRPGYDSPVSSVAVAGCRKPRCIQRSPAGPLRASRIAPHAPAPS